MTDTPTEVRDRYAHQLLCQTPARRLEMACSMFASAKALVIAGIRMRDGVGTLRDERKAIFIRLYAADLSPDEKASVVAHLRAA